MRQFRARLTMAMFAGTSALLACLLVPRLRLTCGFAPDLCDISTSDIILPPHAWTGADYGYLLLDTAFWFAICYGALRGFFMMLGSPHRLPFSRKRAYGEDLTGKLPREQRLDVRAAVEQAVAALVGGASKKNRDRSGFSGHTRSVPRSRESGGKDLVREGN